MFGESYTQLNFPVGHIKVKVGIRVVLHELAKSGFLLLKRAHHTLFLVAW